MSSNGRKQGPDFICIGAQKAGTTWLYDQLVHHPQVWLPVIKELHYFNFERPNPLLREKEVYPWGSPVERFRFIRNRPDFKTLMWLAKYNYGKKSPRWYQSLFPSESGKIAGELTPAYSTLDEDGVRFVHESVPSHTKVFIILRDPVDRIWSGLKMDFRWRKEGLNLNQDEAERELLRPTHLLRSAYSHIIPMWESYFRGRFQVFFYEDLVRDPALFLCQIMGFLGIDPQWRSSTLSARSNADKLALPIPDEIRELLRRELKEDISFVLERFPDKGLTWLG